jgi:hypothetical protein
VAAVGAEDDLRAEIRDLEGRIGGLYALVLVLGVLLVGVLAVCGG